jgi:hypothetical protein
MVEGWKAWAAMEVEEESERLRGWWREREEEEEGVQAGEYSSVCQVSPMLVPCVG